jgi:hypothetical protein
MPASGRFSVTLRPRTDPFPPGLSKLFFYRFQRINHRNLRRLLADLVEGGYVRQLADHSRYIPTMRMTSNVCSTAITRGTCSNSSRDLRDLSGPTKNAVPQPTGAALDGAAHRVRQSDGQETRRKMNRKAGSQHGKAAIRRTCLVPSTDATKCATRIAALLPPFLPTFRREDSERRSPCPSNLRDCESAERKCFREPPGSYKNA